MSKLFIIGFMGSGKSTISRLLSQKLNIQLIDSDEYIEQKENLRISEIFKIHGEKSFRDIETKALKDICKKEDFVCSTGGGMPCFNDNITTMSNTGTVIYLYMSNESLINRFKALSPQAKSVRPLLNGKTDEELKTYIDKTLSERSVFYQKANITLDTNGYSPQKICDMIIMLLNYNKK